MAWNKGTLDFMVDPRAEFADKTGHLLTGMNFRPTVTGWALVVKRVNMDTKTREVLFLDSWSLQELFELFYEEVVVAGNLGVWKPDKF